MTRIRQAVVLLLPSFRTAAWLPLLPAGALGLAVLSLEGDVVLQLRLAAVVLCVGAAFVLDDAAFVIAESSPAPLLFRRLVRIALVLPLVAALWALLVTYAGVSLGSGLTLELAAMEALTLAAASAGALLVPDGRGGLAAAPALLVLLATAVLALPEGWTLFASGPTDPRWAESHVRWVALFAAGVAVFLYASLDPGRSRLLPRRPRREPISLADATDPA